MKLHIHLNWHLAKSWDDPEQLLSTAREYTGRPALTAKSPEVYAVWPHVLRRLRILLTNLVLTRRTLSGVLTAFEATLSHIESTGLPPITPTPRKESEPWTQKP